MKRLLASLMLLATAWVQGADEPPAAATRPVAAPERVDGREAVLRDLENRTAHLQRGRQGMHQAIVDMAADPTISPRVRQIGCEASIPAMRATEFFKYARGRVKILEKSENFALLEPGQVERLTQVKVLLAELEGQPDPDCSKM
jgi:hypothetical protein